MSENNNRSLATMEEEEAPCHAKPNYKRRSTFFRRRSMLQAPCDKGSHNANEENPDTGMVDRIENLDPDNSKKNENEKSSFDLKKYIDDLKEEKRMWKKTLHDRKKKHKTILKQISNMKREEQDLDLSALSETDRQFLLVRPNYEHIYEKAKKLSIMAFETSLFNNHVEHLHKRCILRAEKKLDDLTTKIIKLVD